MHQARYYEHSGEFSLPGALTAFALAAAAGVPVAFVYAYLILYIPVAGYITFILSCAFGAVVGLAAGTLLKKSRTRNGAVATGIGLAATAVAWYASWGAWTHALLRRSNLDVALLDLLTQPAWLWELVGRINEQGAWTMSGSTPTGLLLWALWTAEAVLILGTGAIVAQVMTSHPFCESCGDWTESHQGVARVAFAPPTTVRHLADNDQIGRVVEFGKPVIGAEGWLRLDVHTCSRCRQFHALDVQHVTLNAQNGKTSDTTVLAKLLVSPAVLQDLQTIDRRLAAHGPSAAPARTGS